jgi:hypothetical protein
VDVTSTMIVLGALASRDWRPMHHDYHFAVQRNGTRGIFMNTPNLAAWFERYLTDWTGPRGRLGRMTFRMRDSVFPDDAMELGGVVRTAAVDAVGSGWVEVELSVNQGGRTCTTCVARIAIPIDDDDNPWSRRDERWRP